jgi:hypothetical protein
MFEILFDELNGLYGFSYIIIFAESQLFLIFRNFLNFNIIDNRLKEWIRV